MLLCVPRWGSAVPIKNQFDAFRIIGGQKYINAGDILAPEHEQLLWSYLCRAADSMRNVAG